MTTQVNQYGVYMDKDIVPFIYNTIAKNPDQIKTNKEGLIYLIFRENYYKKIFKAVQKAGQYNHDNKRYYFVFYDFLTKKKTRLNSKEIYLAINGINTKEKLKCYVGQQLVDNRLINREFYEKNYSDSPYNFMSMPGFSEYLKTNIYYYLYNNTSLNCNCDYRNTTDPLTAFENNVPIYNAFRDVYNQALLYSNIYNKINQVKNMLLKVKKTNCGINIQKSLFVNLAPGETHHVYPSNEILLIYNTMKNLFK